MVSYGSRNERDGITSRFRLRGYDYSLPGYYFVTICIDDRSHRLGAVRDGWFFPSPAGEMVSGLWEEQETHFPGLELDAWCLMPNHFHAVVGIGTLDERDADQVALPAVMQGFKAATTTAYGAGVRNLGWPPYDGRLWQKGYHDHIVRNDRDLERIRDYIDSNASMWEGDVFFTMESTV